MLLKLNANAEQWHTIPWYTHWLRVVARKRKHRICYPKEWKKITRRRKESCAFAKSKKYPEIETVLQFNKATRARRKSWAVRVFPFPYEHWCSSSIWYACHTLIRIQAAHLPWIRCKEEKACIYKLFIYPRLSVKRHYNLWASLLSLCVSRFPSCYFLTFDLYLAWLLDFSARISFYIALSLVYNLQSISGTLHKI